MFNGMKAVAVAAAFCLAGPGQAATLDLVGASNDGQTLVAAGATIVAGASTTLSVGDFVANAVCPLGGFGCNGSMTLTFDGDVSGVNFNYGYGNVGDSATLWMYDSLNALLGTLMLTSDSGVAFADLSAFGTLRSIFFDNTASTGAGYAYGDITYTPGASPIPLPATLPLLLAASGALLALRRSRRA